MEEEQALELAKDLDTPLEMFMLFEFHCSLEIFP